MTWVLFCGNVVQVEDDEGEAGREDVAAKGERGSPEQQVWTVMVGYVCTSAKCVLVYKSEECTCAQYELCTIAICVHVEALLSGVGARN